MISTVYVVHYVVRNTYSTYSRFLCTVGFFVYFSSTNDIHLFENILKLCDFVWLICSILDTVVRKEASIVPKCTQCHRLLLFQIRLDFGLFEICINSLHKSWQRPVSGRHQLQGSSGCSKLLHSRRRHYFQRLQRHKLDANYSHHVQCIHGKHCFISCITMLTDITRRRRQQPRRSST